MIKQFFKKVLIIYLVVIACVFTPTYRAYAASPSGFSFSKYDIIAGAITAIKNSVSVKANFTPPPSTVVKFMGSVAVAYAVAKYGGQAIDWVMSADAQSVSRNKQVDGMLYTIGGDCSKSGTTPQAACDVINTLNNTSEYKAKSSTSCGSSLVSFPIKYQMCSTTVKETHQLTEFVPDVISDAKNGVPAAVDIVNNAVRDAFNSGLADPALTQAYDAVKADNEAHNCGTGTSWNGSVCVADTPSTPSTPTTPDTPFDPSSILDAIASLFDAVMSISDVINTAIDKVLDAIASITDVINTAIDKVLDAIASITDVINLAIDKVINAIKDIIKPLVDLLTSFIDWFKDKFTALYDAITDFFDWVKDTATDWKDDFVDEYKAFRDWVKAEPTPENPTQPDVTTLPTPPTDSVDISFDGGCPAPNVIPWSLAGQNVDMTISYTPICDTATLLNPIIKLAASLGAVFIIAGIRRGDDG